MFNWEKVPVIFVTLHLTSLPNKNGGHLAGLSLGNLSMIMTRHPAAELCTVFNQSYHPEGIYDCGKCADITSHNLPGTVCPCKQIHLLVCLL